MSRVMRQFLWVMHYIPKHRVFNKSTLIVEQSMHIFFETNATSKKVVDGDDVGIENTKEEEPKNTNFKESKDEPSLEAW